MYLPEKNSFINVHTHIKARIDDEFAILNINATEVDTINPEEGTAYSAGLHPWNVEAQDHQKELQMVEEASKLDCVLAIGEVGLDKNYFENYDRQEEIFRSQIEIAEKVGKPLIIHCVRSYPDILRIKKDVKTSVPWIIHGYNFNIVTAEKLVKEGCYLSFGNGLFIPGTKVQYIFARIDSNKFLLETDEDEKNIMQVYTRACEIQKIELDKMITQVADNYKNCFNL